MQTQAASLPDQFLQDDQQVVGGLNQEGVVIKGDILEAQALLPMGQLRDHRGGAAAPEVGLQQAGGAVAAVQGAPPGGQDGKVGQVIQEVQGGIGQLVEVGGHRKPA